MNRKRFPAAPADYRRASARQSADHRTSEIGSAARVQDAGGSLMN
jgi:hypothetical protein